MTATQPVITLLSDFGLRDEYVGVIKGVLLSQDINIHIVDISHSVPPQNIQVASHLLARSYSYFPAGTVHLVIVDPGVGSERPIMAIAADSYYFVGPDNGVFSAIIRNAKDFAIHQVIDNTLFLPSVSNTFHGRDIMAPVAARLAGGLAIDRVGPRIDPAQCVLLEPSSCKVINGTLQGEITHIDHFGNLCTNIRREDVESYSGGKRFTIRAGHVSINSMSSTYSCQAEGNLLALYDSNNYLEIAESQGNAANCLRLSPGSQIYLTRTT